MSNYQLRSFARERLGKYRESIEDVTEALKHAPHDDSRASLHLALARAHEKLGHKTEAMSCVNRSLQFAPHFSKGLMLRALMNVTRGEYEAALKDRNVLLQQSPQDMLCVSQVWPDSALRSALLCDLLWCVCCVLRCVCANALVVGACTL